MLEDEVNREPPTISLVPPLTFSFIGAFTGQLKKIHGFTLNPMVRIEKGMRYDVAIDVMTGETGITPRGMQA